MIAYLQKSEGSEGFHQIIDFLNSSHIQYALIENPTIYVSFIKQFWRTATPRTSATGEDNGGVTTLPNSEIFEQLALIGYATDSDKLTFQKEGYSGEDIPEVSTAGATPEVSTVAANLVCIRRSAEKRKDKGKAIMIEDESVQNKSKKQLEQERLSHEEANRLQEQIDEEERKRIARDVEIAKQLQEEYDKAGKKEVVTEVDTTHVIDWNDPSVIRYHALQNRPRSVAEVRKNMLMYLKNQGGYKMEDFKGISYDDIRPVFEKYGIKFIHLCLWILKKKFKD
ncbi:hypothetical protein Tco_0716933 [Tanacetum coccineum]